MINEYKLGERIILSRIRNVNTNQYMASRIIAIHNDYYLVLVERGWMISTYPFEINRSNCKTIPNIHVYNDVEVNWLSEDKMNEYVLRN